MSRRRALRRGRRANQQTDARPPFRAGLVRKRLGGDSPRERLGGRGIREPRATTLPAVFPLLTVRARGDGGGGGVVRVETLALRVGELAEERVPRRVAFFDGGERADVFDHLGPERRQTRVETAERASRHRRRPPRLDAVALFHHACHRRHRHLGLFRVFHHPAERRVRRVAAVNLQPPEKNLAETSGRLARRALVQRRTLPRRLRERAQKCERRRAKVPTRRV